MSHIECVKNNGVPYLRLAESRYDKNKKRQKKIIIKNLGPLSKFDDGKPDFLKDSEKNLKTVKLILMVLHIKIKCCQNIHMNLILI